MQTVVLILMLLVCFGFLLKQTFQGRRTLIATAAVCALFVVLAKDYAIEQSKSQIADWLQNPALMLDTSVVLFIDVFLNMAYAMLSAYMLTTGQIRRRTLRCYKALRLFPGLLFFPVLFYLLVQTVFMLPGTSFSLIAWSLAAAVGIVLPLCALALRWLLPEKEIRLELLFLLNALIGIIGVVATVNGRTAVAAVANIDWTALAGTIAIALVGILCGAILNKIVNRKFENSKIR